MLNEKFKNHRIIALKTVGRLSYITKLLTVQPVSSNKISIQLILTAQQRTFWKNASLKLYVRYITIERPARSRTA